MFFQLTKEQRAKFLRLDKFPLTLPPEHPPLPKDNIDLIVELGRRPPTYLLGWKLSMNQMDEYLNDGRWHTAADYRQIIIIPKWNVKYSETLGRESSPRPFICRDRVIWYIASNHSETVLSRARDAMEKGLVAAAEDVLNLPTDLEESSRLKWYRITV